MKKGFTIIILSVLLAACGAPKCKKVDLSGLNILTDYKTSLTTAKNDNKPILVYFSSYTQINCRVFEDYILTNSCVQKKINDEFVFVQLYTGDGRQKHDSDVVKDLQFKYMESTGFFTPSWIIIDNNERLFKRIEQSELEFLTLKNHNHPSLVLSESNKFISYLEEAQEAIKNNDTIILLDPISDIPIVKELQSEVNFGKKMNYDNLPSEQKIFSFDFTYEITDGDNESGPVAGIIIKISNPKGADVLAPEQESGSFIPMELNVRNPANKNGKLNFPKPDKRIEEGIDETLLFYDDKMIVLKQSVKLKGKLPLRIRGEIVFSWIYQNAITAPVTKEFEMIII